jgi:hypothetical protein
MNRLYALLGVYWAAMTLLSLMVVIYRKPLARRLRPRMRHWSNRPDAQLLYERSVLLGGIGLGTFSVILLYVHFAILPSLERTHTRIRSATLEIRPAACGDPI